MHNTNVVLPSVHATWQNGHSSVMEATRVTTSKVWTIIQCDQNVESHVIASTIASVKKEVHTWTRRGGEDSQDEEWSSRGPVKLQKMAIGVETAGDKAGLQCKGEFRNVGEMKFNCDLGRCV